VVSNQKIKGAFMTLIANSKASLLVGLNNSKNQPAVPNSTGAGPSTFSLALDDTDSDLGLQTHLGDMVPNSKSTLGTAVLELDDASKDNHAAPVADAVWLANWFQTNAPATASSPVPSLGSSSAPVEPVRVGTASKPLTMRSSEPISRADVPISDISKSSPWVCPVKPGYALPPASATATSSTPQSTFHAVSIDTGFLDSQPPKNSLTDTGHSRPLQVFNKVSIDIVGSVKLGQSVGFNEFNDFENDRGTAVSPGSAQLRIEPHVGFNLMNQTVGTEAVHSHQSPVALGTSNWVVPVWAETASKPVARPSSELSAPIDVTISDQSKKSPSVLPDKPASALAPASATTPLTAAVILPLPTPSTAQAIFQSAAQPAIQPVAQFASIGVGLLDNRSLKNLPSDSGHLRPVEALSKATIDIVGSVKLGQSDGFKEFKDFESDRGLTVTLGSSQISLDFHAGSNLPQQVVGTGAEPPVFNQDAQWTSNLADTVNQWVERSLQLAELTVPDAGQDSLQVRIELNGQEATVYFLTDHVQYREAIESQIENLSDRLADQGLKLAGSFVGQGSSQNSPQEQSAHSMLSRRHEGEPASAKALSIDPVLRDLKSVHQGLVLDVFA
jgi:hypothetical protein